MLIPTTCCAHRNADHKPQHGEATARRGAPCSVPGCRCKGWVPRKGTAGRGRRPDRKVA